MGEAKIPLDVPSNDARMGFGDYARALADIIINSEPRFAIGIFGTWGSGKTTLMHAIRRELERDAQIVAIEFSAWRYEKEEHLIVPLLDTLRDGLERWATEHAGTLDRASRLASAAASTIGKVIACMLAGFSLKSGLPGTIDLSFKANDALAKAGEMDAASEEAARSRSFYHASFRALSKAQYINAYTLQMKITPRLDPDIVLALADDRVPAGLAPGQERNLFGQGGLHSHARPELEGRARCADRARSGVPGAA